MRYAMKFAYDGTKFSGLQRQPKQNTRTIEGEILKCLNGHQIINDVRSSKFQVASRTDTGVSALGNVLVINSEWKIEKILKILNSKINGCWFYGFARVDENFKPRHAESRWYRYYLFNTMNMDIEKIRSLTKLFIGEHDFKNFAKPNISNTVRTITSIDVTSEEPWIIFDLKGSGFLWNQVRRLVSAWIGFGQNEFSFEELDSALQNPAKDFDFGLAPAEPLVLMDVEYTFKFIVDERILKKTKSKLIKECEKLELRNEILKLLLKRI